MCSLGYCYMGSPIQRTSIHREMHVCIILLRPLLLVLLLFISRFISGLGCRYTRSVRKNGMWSSETAWTVLHHIIQYTHYTYTLISFTTEKRITLSTDATAIVAAAFAVAMISHAFDAQVSTDKMNISNLCVFFSSSPVCLFVCLFVLLAISEVFCSSGKFEYSIYQHAKRFVAFNSEILAFCFELIHLSMRLNDCEIRLSRFHSVESTPYSILIFLWCGWAIQWNYETEQSERKRGGGEEC